MKASLERALQLGRGAQTPSEFAEAVIEAVRAADLAAGAITITKAQLQRALEASGVSYERPPALDADDVWKELTS